MMSLTPRQNDCLDFLRGYIAERGTSPTYAEIAIELHLKSKSGVARIMDSLVARGAIRKLRHKARAIEIVDAAGITIRLRPEVHKAAKAYAASQKILLESVIEEAVAAYVLEPS